MEFLVSCFDVSMFSSEFIYHVTLHSDGVSSVFLFLSNQMGKYSLKSKKKTKNVDIFKVNGDIKWRYLQFEGVYVVA